MKHRFAYTPPYARQSKDGYSWRVEHRFDLYSTRSQTPPATVEEVADARYMAAKACEDGRPHGTATFEGGVLGGGVLS